MIVVDTPLGLVPVEGVSIQVNMTKPATTDSNGFYSIPELVLTGLAPNISIGNFNTVTAWKPTYVNDTRIVTISGDMRHDIQLIRRATFTLSGVVTEETPTGLAPLEGVEIHDWSCDPTFPGNRLPVPSDGCNYGLSHSTTTDRNGRSRFGRVCDPKFALRHKRGLRRERGRPGVRGLFDVSDAGRRYALRYSTRPTLTIHQR